MSTIAVTTDNVRPPQDKILQDIANYVHAATAPRLSDLAMATARLCLIDTLGCGIEALKHPACKRLLAPVVPATNVPAGARVPGTSHVLDPVRATFAIGAQIRWLDFNDCWLAAEWGHPSDNLAGLLAVADWMTRTYRQSGTRVVPFARVVRMAEILELMVRAHEIQGLLALDNAFNEVGLDHVVLVKVATASVVARLVGLNRTQIADAVSHAFVDGQALRTYRHAPNTGPRKSWAAGDAAARAVNLVLMVQQGEPGLPSILTAPTWGFYDVLFKHQIFSLQRPFGSYVMENVLFKVSFPAEFHAQTAVEAAVDLHHELQTRRLTVPDHIAAIDIKTQAAGNRIINKTGPLYNYADRDHCIQYMVAVALVSGQLTAENYSDAYATSHEKVLHSLRSKMTCSEEPAFTADYHDPQKRFIANRVTITLTNGEQLTRQIDYPLGHRLRRDQAVPAILDKFERHVRTCFDQDQANAILRTSSAADNLDEIDVDSYMDLYVKQ
ncbi:MmgE/PrpD family-domain-containing protein [Lipomyces japonicus]|uniref:MmgE/PrpD family-domain-containing protein n=1 Tax=Lipomyces japonicus TaxID=56871 RepID=UPI0034CDED1E